MKISSIAFMLLSLTCLSSCTDLEREEAVTVFCASSTTDLIGIMGDLFEKETGYEVRINSASSGILSRQLEQSAEADVFISASEHWMDNIERLGMAEMIRPFLKNRLVLIAPSGSGFQPFIMDGEVNLPSLFTGRLSMGDPDHVPAGFYGKQALESLGWYESLEKRILPAFNVRSALSVVELDETDLGIVYETDALKSEFVEILSFFPEDSHSPVLYYCALISESSTPGRIFYDFIHSSFEAGDLLSKYGFSRAGD